ncbi:trans-sialidase, putative [Trypanosoma cruzi marinkellei]|uniref:Trans-sialidase, putative n=1 Tax=Trypanosoma cruzi marinkellei TaxID=85056 RepID=K2NNI4_TRYCR|nr:trans-sialidase, putative [Trypanosoma cruzi marinkellei]
MSSASCFSPRITEWVQGNLLMVVGCEDGQRVYESRDMGRTWAEAVGALPGVWTGSQSGVRWDRSLHVDALITATIGKRKVMLYSQRRRYFSGTREATALYLWVTDNNRSFYVGPVTMEDEAGWMLPSTLLYSDGNLHLLQQRDTNEGSSMSLSRLTEELSTIESVLSTWVQKDIFFSSFSIPTAGLVAVLSNASVSKDTWNDEYLCLNATVKSATKAEDGFQLTEPNSRVSWFVNTRDEKPRHVFLSHNFTLVASVTIQKAPSKNTSLLTARLGDTNSPYTMRLSYAADKTWEKAFEDKTTTQSSSWELGKEHQVALMLQGNKASVYIDGKSLGEEEVPLTDETPFGFVYFCFGACADEEGQEHELHVKVTNVFLYNRPLNSTEMSAIKERVPIPTGEVEGASQATASAGNGGTAGGAGDGGTNDDDFSVYGGGLLPLLLLLGLWLFAAA